MRIVIFLILISYSHLLFSNTVKPADQVEFCEYDKNKDATYTNVVSRDAEIIITMLFKKDIKDCKIILKKDSELLVVKIKYDLETRLIKDSKSIYGLLNGRSKICNFTSWKRSISKKCLTKPPKKLTDKFPESTTLNALKDFDENAFQIFEEIGNKDSIKVNGLYYEVEKMRPKIRLNESKIDELLEKEGV